MSNAKPHWLRYWAILSIVSNRHVEGSRGSQPTSTTSASDKSLPRVRRVVGMHDAFSDHLSLFTSSSSSTHWTLGPSTSRLTAGLLRQFPPLQLLHKCSNENRVQTLTVFTYLVSGNAIFMSRKLGSRLLLQCTFDLWSTIERHTDATNVWSW